MNDKESHAEQLALWIVRNALRPTLSPFRLHTARHVGQWQDFLAIGALLRRSNDQLAEKRGQGLDVAAKGQLGLTRDEDYFLLATAASQAEAEPRLQDALAALCPGHQMIMAGTVAALAAVLAAHDHWLPAPCPDRTPLPCAALSMARHRFPAWHRAAVLWP
jgi:hypothetical protein